jgi:hypothetical protein
MAWRKRLFVQLPPPRLIFTHNLLVLTHDEEDVSDVREELESPPSISNSTSVSGISLLHASARRLRHRVERMDRLPGNEAIHAGRLEIYGRLTGGWTG